MKKIMMIALAAVLSFACQKNDGPKTDTVKAEMNSAVQEDFVKKDGFSIYALSFSSADGFSMTANFAAGSDAVPMPSGKYTHKENVSAANEMTIKSFTKGETAYKVKDAEANVEHDPATNSYTIAISGSLDNSYSFEIEFKGTVNGMQEPKRKDNIELVKGSLKEYTEGESGKFSTFRIALEPGTDVVPYLEISFAAEQGVLPLAAGDYSIKSTLAASGEAMINLYSDTDVISHKDCESGTVSVTYNEEDKTYGFIFTDLEFSNLILNGSFTGEIAGMRYPSTGNVVEVNATKCTVILDAANGTANISLMSTDKPEITAGVTNVIINCSGDAIPVGTFEYEDAPYLYNATWGKTETVPGGQVTIAETDNGHSVEITVTAADGTQFVFSFDGNITIM